MGDFGWHFTNDKLRDGSPIPPVGKWISVKGPLELCAHGLHFSKQPFDALQYAPGPLLHRVEVRGEILHGEDKGCASERRIVQSMDATELLRYFARMQALSVVHLWDVPEVVLDYLMTGDEAIRDAARDAASAARAAAWDAWDAAWDAWDAARSDFNALVEECFS